MQVLKGERKLEPQGVQLNWSTLVSMIVGLYLDVFDVSWFECPKFNVLEVVSPVKFKLQGWSMMGASFPKRHKI